MNFSFGIITCPDTQIFMDKIINSIRALNISNYEIIVVGGTKKRGDTFIDFSYDNYIKPGWITKKKNLITQQAKFDNVVYAHDYIFFDPDWYKGFIKFGDDWDVCMNRILTVDGQRYRDWCVCNGIIACDDPDLPHGTLNVPYTYNKTKYMYVSGAYWVAKKDFMTKYPLDEAFLWGQGEDGVWARSARNVWNYKMNIYSTVRCLRPKQV